MEEYKITIQHTANYHPQANPVERTHRVLKTMLSCYISDDQKKWDKVLPKVSCAIRSARHDVTGHTPNFLVFGREINYHPVTKSPPDSDNVSDVDHEQRSKSLSKLFAEVQKKLQQAYQTSRNRYNLRRRDDRFQLNQQVFKRNFVLSDASKQFTAKLNRKYSGPFIITKILSPWSYELSDLTGKSLGVYHAKDLKAHPPDDSIDQN